jgi:integrating conjugative element protein (TIGR03761 family)
MDNQFAENEVDVSSKSKKNKAQKTDKTVELPAPVFIVIPYQSIPRPLTSLYKKFIKSDKSLFTDGYDHIEEKQVMKTGNFDEQRLYEFDVRCSAIVHEMNDILAKTKPKQFMVDLESFWKVKIVQKNDNLANNQFLPGRLIDDETSILSLHTSEAVQLFNGYANTKTNRNNPGFKQLATSLTKLWMLTDKNNPYLDQALVDLENSIKSEQREFLNDIKDIKEKVIPAFKEQTGISVKIMVSKEPVEIPLNFTSQYGYWLASVLGNFDLYVRHIHTLNKFAIGDTATMMDNQSRRQAIFDYKKPLIAIIYKAYEYERKVFSHLGMQSINRSDFVIGSPNFQTIVNLTRTMKMLPSLNVLLGEELPMFSRIGAPLTPGEKQKLKEAHQYLLEVLNNG